jgi:hypothetical protein
MRSSYPKGQLAFRASHRGGLFVPGPSKLICSEGHPSETQGQGGVVLLFISWEAQEGRKQAGIRWGRGHFLMWEGYARP